MGEFFAGTETFLQTDLRRLLAIVIVAVDACERKTARKANFILAMIEPEGRMVESNCEPKDGEKHHE
jgi:hypothetical protein